MASWICLQTPKIAYTATFTAYSLEVSQTDGNPCVGASNHNLCVCKEIKTCASRDLPLHTLINIKGIGKCEILDRMNIRYKGTGNIDILMDSREEALKFGRQKLEYYIVDKSIDN